MVGLPLEIIIWKYQIYQEDNYEKKFVMEKQHGFWWNFTYNSKPEAIY